jgi:hypothetical protein
VDHIRIGLEAVMTRAELAEKLEHLDPGASLPLDRQLLAQMFGAEGITDEVASEIEAFAEQHRCTFAQQGHDEEHPEFVKNDVF